MALLVCDALESRGGEGTIVEVATFIWENYKDELEASGEIFYTWQYDMRWARHRLSEKGKLITKSRGSDHHHPTGTERSKGGVSTFLGFGREGGDGAGLWD